MNQISQTRFITASGVSVTHQQQACDGASEMARRLPMLDHQRGMAMVCGVDYPGRYRRHQLIFANPPLQIIARQRELRVEALNARGKLLLHECRRALDGSHADFELLTVAETQLVCRVTEQGGFFAEELRTRQPSVFSVLRQLIAHFACSQNDLLGLYGAFAYDLAFQFEAVTPRLDRSAVQRDLVLYLPDEILTVDPGTDAGIIHRFDFVCRDAAGGQHTTGGLRRQGAQLAPGLVGADSATDDGSVAPLHKQQTAGISDHQPGEYAAVVEKAKTGFARGDLFEVVPGQTFSTPLRCKPSTIFLRLKDSNPAPYAALINLGEQEYLISASPEMFVRVKPDAALGDLVETCPISGTIARGGNALEDADRIRQLLNSAKDEAELSMCTDVDRNDKSRVCVPGSVSIVGRRQVELYSRLIHTVDHVQGRLQTGFDALDAFLSHTWAVTVTGAPKQRAMQFIEDHEKTPRGWYGGAFGRLGFDGAMDTGLTIRTVLVNKSVAQVRAGATLLQDSDPVAEEQETRLKASALLSVLKPEAVASARALTPASVSGSASKYAPGLGTGLRALMIDHQDSFVHTLAAGFRAAGVDVQTLRPQAAREALKTRAFDLVILSPGPGRPADFDCDATLALCETLGVMVFGVCLGLQAMIEYAGGTLALLPRPVHGSASAISHQGNGLFNNIESPFNAGRYHSIHAGQVPAGFSITARSSDDDCVMAVAHENKPWSAVQFHPESLLTLAHGAGDQLIRNVVHEALALNRRFTSAQRIGGYHRQQQ